MNAFFLFMTTVQEVIKIYETMNKTEKQLAKSLPNNKGYNELTYSLVWMIKWSNQST